MTDVLSTTLGAVAKEVLKVWLVATVLGAVETPLIALCSPNVTTTVPLLMRVLTLHVGPATACKLMRRSSASSSMQIFINI